MSSNKSLGSLIVTLDHSIVCSLSNLLVAVVNLLFLSVHARVIQLVLLSSKWPLSLSLPMRVCEFEFVSS